MPMEARPNERLFAALHPTRGVAEEAYALCPPGGRPVDLERLHVTIAWLGDFPELPDAIVRRSGQALSDVRLPTCHVAFDRLIGGRRSTLLLPSEPLIGVVGLQRQIAGAFARAGIPLPKRPPNPHMTLRYPGCAVDEPIDILSWRAKELVLIWSRLDRHEHIPLVRWPLHG